MCIRDSCSADAVYSVLALSALRVAPFAAKALGAIPIISKTEVIIENKSFMVCSL